MPINSIKDTSQLSILLKMWETEAACQVQCVYKVTVKDILQSILQEETKGFFTTPLYEIIWGMDSNFSLSPKSTLHFLGGRRLGRIHRKEDIQPLRETIMEWSVGGVFKRGLRGMEIRTASGTEDTGHGPGTILCF